NLHSDDYDLLFDHLQQYEVNVNASRAKRAAKSHDPLALVANTYASSSSYDYDLLFDHLQQYEVNVNASRAKRAANSHDPLALVANTYASSSSCRSPQAYYVTHPPLVIGNDDDYQGEVICDDQEDTLKTTMMLLARAITQRYFTPINNHLRTSSNTINQAIVQADHVDIQSKNVKNGRRIPRTTTNSKNGPNVQCSICNAKGHYARDFLKPKVRNSKYFKEQMLLAKKDEAWMILDDEQMIFYLRMHTRQYDSDNGPIYDFDFINEDRNDSLSDEIEKIQNESKYVQENLLKRIKILENYFQRCQAQSIDFELQLQHQKEKTNCEKSLNNVCENSWISKMEKLESENVSLEFQVQYLVKKNENVKLEYQKLFDSIKKTQTQTQKEINELIESVNQKTYAYGDVRS
ncbi:integrase, catalytic region, zinc finger, CCHC-type containing protein, partial [Tanacetum coccineum]